MIGQNLGMRPLIELSVEGNYQLPALPLPQQVILPTGLSSHSLDSTSDLTQRSCIS